MYTMRFLHEMSVAQATSPPGHRSNYLKFANEVLEMPSSGATATQKFDIRNTVSQVPELAPAGASIKLFSILKVF